MLRNLFVCVYVYVLLIQLLKGDFIYASIVLFNIWAFYKLFNLNSFYPCEDYVIDTIIHAIVLRDHILLFL